STHTTHIPARVSRAIAPVERPTTTSNVHIPSENTNKYKNPNAALLVVATHVSTAAMTGAEHGAATRPDIAPMVNAPDARPAVPAVLARTKIAFGMRTGRTSSIARAASSSRFAMARYNHGLVLTDPKSVPERPANRPRAE